MNGIIRAAYTLGQFLFAPTLTGILGPDLLQGTWTARRYQMFAFVISDLCIVPGRPAGGASSLSGLKSLPSMDSVTSRNSSVRAQIRLGFISVCAFYDVDLPP